MNIAYLIISYNRIDQAKAQMELIKNLFSQTPTLSNIDIFHAFNGNYEDYAKPYFDEKIIRRKNLGHFHGACDLINSGIDQILKEDKKYDYIIVASADVWFVNPQLIEKSVKLMHDEHKLLCTSLWFLPAFATEFFIIDPQLAQKVFPLDLKDYEKRHPLRHLLSTLIKHPTVELLFYEKVGKNGSIENDVIYFEKMERITLKTRWIRHEPKYYSPHSMREIKKVIEKEDLTKYGETFQKLLLK